MPKITISREDTNERILALAVERGYSPTTEVMVEYQKEVPRTDVEGNPELDEDGNQIIDLVDGKKPETQPNHETAIEFIAKYYQKVIDNDIALAFIDITKRELEEKRKLEDEAIQAEIQASVGISNIITA